MRTIYVDKHIPKMVMVKGLKRVWPGVVFSPLSPARFAHLPDPDLPGPRWVRVENLLCGICATDLSLLEVNADPQIGPAALPGFQRFYLGHEVVGRISEVGTDVTSLQEGDRVLMNLRMQGANCLSQELDEICPQCQAGNYALCQNSSLGVGPRGVGGGWSDGFTAHETEVYPVPDSLTDEQAVMVEPVAVGVRTALRRLPASGENVLVVGSGVIGLMVIQAVRVLAPECQITVIARYPQQADMAQALGAHTVIGREDPYQAVASLTGGHLYEGMMGSRMILGGYDVVYDCVGSAKTLEDSLRWARAGGTVVMAGVNLTKLKLDLNPIWYQEVNLIGLNSHGSEEWQGQRISSYDLAIQLIRAGKVETESLITHHFALENWREAINTSQNKRTGAIKVIFDYRLS